MMRQLSAISTGRGSWISETARLERRLKPPKISTCEMKKCRRNPTAVKETGAAKLLRSWVLLY
jgi:uncharacterized membrane-anchored protein